MNAHDGAGFTYLTRHEPDAAVEAFRKALALFPDHARSLVGLGAALVAAGDVDGSQAALAKAATAIEALRRGGRSSESLIAEAMSAAVQGDAERAFETLHALLDKPDIPFSGWTIPIEPLLAPLRKLPEYQRVTGRLAERAR